MWEENEVEDIFNNVDDVHESKADDDSHTFHDNAVNEYFVAYKISWLTTLVWALHIQAISTIYYSQT